MDFELSELTSEQKDEKLRALFVKLEFSAFLSRFNLSEATESAPEFTVPEVGEGSVEGLCSVAFDGENIIAFDGKNRISASPEALRETLEGGVICHDYKKLCRALIPYNIEPVCVFDTMTAAYLLSPGESSYPAEKLALRYLGVSCEGADDAVAFALKPVLEKELSEQGMTDVLKNIEIPLSPVLAEMEHEGFTLDCEGLRAYIRDLMRVQDELAARVYMAAGREFNINSPKQLGEVLFEEMGLPVLKKTKTGYSTDAETLSKLRAENPIVEDILDFRHVAKLVGTYGENLIALCDDKSKIHTSFNQTGTATGRLSSVDPNMQNIPVKGEMGRELRRYFKAKSDDYVLLDADYSQIELRLLAEISGDEAMTAAFRDGMDIHASTASKVFGVALDMVTPQLRSRAKAVNFGIVYGIGDYSLSQDIGVSRKAAREYIDSYLATYTGVDNYLKNTVSDAKEKGYTVTPSGRRRPIPELSAKNKNLQAFGERVAMNSPIQGGAADIIKIAMINVRRALRDAGIDAKLILQVHDELIIEARRDCADVAAEILKREMENAVKTNVPLTADVGRGENWLEAKN